MKDTAEDIERRALRRSLRSRGPLMRAARGLTRFLGWMSFGALLLALLAENHPALERWVARTIQTRVGGPLTRSVEVADIDFRWLDRAVALSGIAMGPTGDELRVDEVVARIGWTWSRGIHLDRVYVQGGTLVISESMAVEMDGTGDTDITTLDILAESPEVVVRDIRIAVVPPSGARIEVGSVDLCVTRITAELASIYGRLVPALGARPEDCGVVWLNGTLDANRIARVRGVAKDLPLSPDPLAGDAGSAGLLPARLYEFDPRARVDLRVHGSFELGRSLLPEFTATLRASEGSLVLPWLERADRRRLDDVEVLLDVAFAPPDPAHPFDPEAWRARGTAAANFEGMRAQVGFRLGRDAPAESVFEVWASLPEVPLGERVAELVAHEPSIDDVLAMLQPDGTADVVVGVRLPRSLEADTPIRHAIERLVLVRTRGDADIAYHGWPNRKSGEPIIGFPVRVNRVSGDITWGVRSRGEYPGHLAFYDVSAIQPGGPVHVQGSQFFTPRTYFPDLPPDAPIPTPFHLVVQTDNLAIDDAFYRAFDGLHAVEGMGDVLQTWNPRGGQVDFRLELWRTADRPETSIAIDTTFDGVSARWREIGVPIENCNGWMSVRTDGPRQRSAIQLALEGVSPVARGPIQVAGRIVGEGLDRSLTWIEMTAAEVNPVHRVLRTELARKNPATVTALDMSGVAGFVDVNVTAVQGFPGMEARAMRMSSPSVSPFLGGMEAWIEGMPSDARSGVQLQPSTLGIVTREVHGKVLAITLLPPVVPNPEELRQAGVQIAREPATRLTARVQGTLRQDGPSVPVIGEVIVEADSPAELVAFGAGLDIARKDIIGALTTAARSSVDAKASDPFDMDMIDVEGRVDFGARAVIPEAPGVPIDDIEIEVEARLDRFGLRDNPLMRDISAHFRYEVATGEWIGEEVDALLGDTPVRLTNLSWTPTEFGSTLRTNLSAVGLPIDREHLSFFLDPTTVRTILDDLDASGTFDMNEAEVSVTRRPDGTTAILLDGDLTVKDAFVNLGVPIELRRIESVRLGLAHEGRGLRSRATVNGFRGSIAGRRLENATLQLTYVEPRLVIEAVDGEFEGGRLRAVGGDLAPGASLFSIDLAPPFPFRLAASMTDVDVGEFLRGVFDSDFANRGRMAMTMRLEGDLEHLTEMKGGGHIQIEESALWAIPVFQALSVSLGIDTTVLFEEMYCDYTIEDGVLVFDRLRIKSDLLALVGTGSISFEGDATADLEVRYDLVDQLGPFTQLLYWIQNSLLRVSVRGTMERPTVVLRGLISQFFAPSEERDRLPLPGFSKRPRRF